MLFIIYCIDRPDVAAIRAATMPAHREYLAAQPIDVVMSGPLTNDAGDTVTGSLFMVEAPDRSAVERFQAADPFFQAGIWATSEIHAFSKRIDKRHPF